MKNSNATTQTSKPSDGLLDHWLGWQVKDKVTGFSGVVASISVDLYGCVQAAVSPPVSIEKETGVQKLETGHYFDLSRLDKCGSAPVMDRVMPFHENSPGGFAKPPMRL